MKKLIKELRHGDRVEQEGGRFATIVSCVPFPIVECATGPTYYIEYQDDDAEYGRQFASGNAEIEVLR